MRQSRLQHNIAKPASRLETKSRGYRLFNCVRTNLGPSNLDNLLANGANNIDNMEVNAVVKF